MVLKQCGQVATIFFADFGFVDSGRPCRRRQLLAERHVQRGDVLHAELLEQGLVAEAAGGVTGALLVAAHDRELDARDVQQLGEGLRGLLGPVLQGAGAADPVQVLDLGEVLDVLADDRDLEVDLLESTPGAASSPGPRGCPSSPGS